MILDKLPNGHFKVDEIVNMLKKHTAKKPIVDLQFLVDNIKYMNSARNYTIKIVKQEKDGSITPLNHVVAVIENARDLEVLKDEIKKTYKRITKKEAEPEKKVVAITTQVDDLAGSSPTARINKNSKAVYGAKMESGKGTNQDLGK